jgi:hypothetical protein
VAANVVRGGQRGVFVETTNRGTRVRDSVLFDQTVIPVDDRGIATTLDGNVCWPATC